MINIIKIFIAPILVFLVVLVGWIIDWRNARKTKTLQQPLRVFLLIIFILGLIWTGFIAVEELKHKEKIERQRQTTEHKMDEIAESVKQLGLTPKILLEKFPLGYAIFEIDYRNDVFLYDNKLVDKYELNWDVAGLKKITPERYEFRLPDIKSKDGNRGMRNIIISGPIVIGGLEGGVHIGTLAIGCRVLDIKRNGIVFLVYFVERPPFPGTPKTPSSNKPIIKNLF